MITETEKFETQCFITTQLIHKNKIANEAVIKFMLRIAYLLDMKGKPCTDSELNHVSLWHCAQRNWICFNMSIFRREQLLEELRELHQESNKRTRQIISNCFR